MSKEKFLFIVQTEDDSIFVESKDEIDNLLKNVEESGEELDFEVIAKVPENRLAVDMNSNAINWYKPESVDKKLTDRVVLSLVQYLIDNKKIR